jgi:hypothetical protein
MLPPPTFTFTASPTSLTVNSGSQGSTTLTITPMNGFNSTVSFACSGLPANATCSFNPATVTPSGAAVTTQLTIAVGAQASVLWQGLHLLPTTGLAVAVCFFWRRRRLLGGALALVLVITGFALLTGCGGGSGGGSGGGGGSSQNYTVTVTSTSATVIQTTNVTLTVN